MAPGLKNLQSKQEGQSLDPKMHIDDGWVWQPTHNSSLRRLRWEIFRVSEWLASLAVSVSSGFD